MKVIIAGGRNFNDYEKLKLHCDKILSNQSDVEIVSGCCDGADVLGMLYAKERSYQVKKFPADWSLGKKAGLLRNQQMANYADALIAFWDGKSTGTKSMIMFAKERSLLVRVIMY